MGCRVIYLIVLLFFIPLPSIYAAKANPVVYPAPLLQLNSYFNHHVLIAEKSTHQLHLYANDNGNPKHLKTYQMMTGKILGDKVKEGDHKTPEGIYFFTEFLPYQSLAKVNDKADELYGVGAFVTDYPNPIDRLGGKTGSGIWLHSTSDQSRIEKKLDSRGCVVASSKHLIEISKYIELERTTIVIVQDLHYLSKISWKTMKHNIDTVVRDWVKAWRNEDSKKYFSFYHPKFKDSSGRKLAGYKQYKRAIFRRPNKPKIELSEVSILQNGYYATVVFKQKYKSKTINDTGRKILYLQKDDNYRWKIVAEKWSRRGIGEASDPVRFKPTMRFFKTDNPVAIFKQAKKD